jgi:GGDEF domain-containing protein
VVDPIERIRQCEELLAARELELQHLRETLDAFLPLDVDTGLLNRNGLIEAIRRCTLWWDRRREQFAVLAVYLPEVDNVADEDRPGLVRHLAATVAATLRQVDEAGRIDDATYVVVLRDFNREGISPITERIRLSVSTASDDQPDFTPMPRLGLCLVQSGDRFAPSAYLDVAIEASHKAAGEMAVVEA